MKLWTSCEVDSDVGDKARLSLMEIDSAVGACLHAKSYGLGIQKWSYICIIIKPGLLPPTYFQEIKLYHKSRKEVEFRLKIDYTNFVMADQETAIKMIVRSILDSVEIAEHGFDLPDFDFSQLKRDLTNCFSGQRWL